MKPLAEKWIKTLRDPETKQEFQALRTVKPDGSVAQCCMGVLCSISKKGRWQGGTTVEVQQKADRLFDSYLMQLPKETRLPSYKLDDDSIKYSDLPYALGDEVGLYQSDMDRLAGINDEGKSFMFIAGVIETMIASNEAQERHLAELAAAAGVFQPVDVEAETY